MSSTSNQGGNAPQIGDTTISTVWLRQVIQESLPDIPLIPEISEAKISGDSLKGGMVGAMSRIIISWPDDADERLPRTLIMKTASPEALASSSMRLMGNAREAYFYQNFAMKKEIPGLESILPRIFYTRGSMETGELMVLMEDLAPLATLSGLVLGNQCWGAVELVKEVTCDPLHVIELVFLKSADMHAHFWRDESLLQRSWLKNVDYLKGSNRDKWESSMDGMRQKWDKISQSVERQETSVVWSPVLLQEMKTALSNTNWENFQKVFDLQSEHTAFTLCHGDFHAGNIFWAFKGNKELYMVDWAEVGVFCPFTDLAQFVISHVPIDLRRQHEHRLFKMYHDRLIAQGVCPNKFPLNSCWERYKAGGIDRWLSMLILLASFDPTVLPQFAVQWFHDQVLSFVEDHSDGNSCLLTAYAIV